MPRMTANTLLAKPGIRLDWRQPTMRRTDMDMRSLIAAGIAATLPAIAIPAFAHHSYAEFDTDKKVTVEGTVKEFQWTNPHSWMLVMVPNARGELEQWAVELNSVSLLAERGWKPKTVLPGDKVAITFHP